MRLTLRTLLAYLDGILSPQDAEEIRKKIEESEYATSLMHRIRDVTRWLRLGAPSLSDRGLGLDPNSVAEYLDNTLAPERVVDFEKICLESDVHLAEVAACHQILTLILGEPAEVDPASRQRMYRLKEASELSTSPGAGTAAIPSSTTPPPLDRIVSGPDKKQPSRLKPTVPDYLRETRKERRWLTVGVMVAVAACFAIVLLWSLGQFQPGTPVGDALVRWGLLQSSPEIAQKPDDSSNKAQPEVGKQPAEQTGQEPAPQKTESPSLPPKEPTVREPSPTEEGKEKPPAKPKEPVEEAPPPEAAKPPTEKLPSEGEKPLAPAEAQAPPVAPPPPGVEAPPPLPPEPLGNLLSSEQVILGDDSAGEWVRIAANQPLVPQRLLVLPTYRAKVELTSGLKLEILGGTRLDLLAGDKQGLPGIRIYYGRLVLSPTEKSGARLRVAFGERQGTLVLLDGKSTAGIQVQRLLKPGSDPEDTPARIVLDLYVTGGDISWEESPAEAGIPALRLAPPQRLSFDAALTSAPIDAKQLPSWMEGEEPLKELERNASKMIAQALPTDYPARLGLMELISTRPQKELKRLALRCMCYIGQFRDMVAALNDPEYKLEWQDYFDELCQAVGRDPEIAAAVRQTLKNQFPQQAEELYRMLWGYSNEDLEAGEDAKLVGALSSDLLAMRVLAYQNLKDITGVGQLYRPQDPPLQRQQAIKRWRQRLEEKKIRVKPIEDVEEKPSETAEQP